MDQVQGNVLQNLGRSKDATEFTLRAAKLTNGLLCFTMFFVYPIECFVTRHVCVVLLFKGRRAHDGDDHSVLARDDRRILLTAFLYIISLIPALLVDDLGSVFSISGALGGSSLSYIAPGACYLGVHGSEFLELVSKRWSLSDFKSSGDQDTCDEEKASYKLNSSNDTSTQKGCLCSFFDWILWYILGMPLWVAIARTGQKMLKKHREAEALKSPHPYRLGKIIHKGSDQVGKPSHRQVNNLIQEDKDFKPVVRVNSIPHSLTSSQLLMPLDNKKTESQLKSSIPNKIDEVKKDDDLNNDSDLSIEPDSQSEGSSIVASESNVSLSSLISDTPQVKDEMDRPEKRSDEEMNRVQLQRPMPPSSSHSQLPQSIPNSPSIHSIHSAGPYFDRRGLAHLRDNTNERQALLSGKKPMYSNVLVKQRPGKQEGEMDPQDEAANLSDFLIAIFFMLFGFMAAFAGIFSVILEGASGA